MAGSGIHKAVELIAMCERISKSVSGEGSRGGKVIGHTQSGKPIYHSSHEIYNSVHGALSRADRINISAAYEKYGAGQSDPYKGPKGVGRRYVGSSYADETNATARAVRSMSNSPHFSGWTEQDHRDAVGAHVNTDGEDSRKHHAARAHMAMSHAVIGKAGNEDDDLPAGKYEREEIEEIARARVSQSPRLHARGNDLLGGQRKVGGDDHSHNQFLATAPEKEILDWNRGERGSDSGGGKTIGRTRSGKPIYRDHPVYAEVAHRERRRVSEPSHDDTPDELLGNGEHFDGWSPADHHDAGVAMRRHYAGEPFDDGTPAEKGRRVASAHIRHAHSMGYREKQKPLLG